MHLWYYEIGLNPQVSRGLPPMKKNTYTAMYVKSGKWWAAYIAEIPGVNTQGRTLKEARGNLAEALQLILEVNRELAAIQVGPEAVCEEIAG